MKQLLPFSPGVVWGFTLFLPRQLLERAAKVTKKGRQKASIGMHGRKSRAHGEERRDRQLREAFVPAFFPVFSDFYLASYLFPAALPLSSEALHKAWFSAQGVMEMIHVFLHSLNGWETEAGHIGGSLTGPLGPTYSLSLASESIHPHILLTG